jgi:DeoR/GlpR family transcriptional regulator of sugar metabolism
MAERQGQGRLGKELRHNRILDELRVKPAIRVSDIAQRLGVHVETIRRDLNELHREGQISRTYGGASPVSVGVEPSLDERDRLLIVERMRMAEKAADLISIGDVIMMDVGSTTTHFARCLANRAKEVRVVTSNWKLIPILGPMPQINLILCPGEYSHEQGGVAGSDTTEFLKRFHADKVVLSGGGITEDGLYEYDSSFAWIKRVMLDCAQERVVIIDHSKFGQKVMDRVCPLSVIDHIVVDRSPDGPLLQSIHDAGIHLHIAAD